MADRPSGILEQAPSQWPHPILNGMEMSSRVPWQDRAEERILTTKAVPRADGKGRMSDQGMSQVRSVQQMVMKAFL